MMDEDEECSVSSVRVQLVSAADEEVGAEVLLTASSTAADLTNVLRGFLPEAAGEGPGRFLFFVDELLVSGSLQDALAAAGRAGQEERVVRVRFQPEAPFRVRPVERCTASIDGHGEAIVALRFAPHSRGLATGSGDTTVRLWDLSTQTPLFTCRGHRAWVLCVEWSPDGRRLASACKNGELMVWDPHTGKRLNGQAMTRHRQWVNALAWKPLHLEGRSRLLASASKDCSVIIWDTDLCAPLRILSAHSKSVTCVKWGGADLLYTASTDRDVKVWRPEDGTLVRALRRHAHWVNWLALSSDFALRTGASAPGPARPGDTAVDSQEDAGEDSEETVRLRAAALYEAATGGRPERMVSCSDDHTMALWRPAVDAQPLARMAGHLQTVIDVKFSPDGRWVASASFDKSIKLWNGLTGAFVATLRGHVNRVYQLAWSGDSRLLVSGSVDSTLKLWSLNACLDPRQRTGARGDGRKPVGDLPGHRDEVYAVDWAPSGQFVASGGKDRVLKLWQH